MTVDGRSTACDGDMHEWCGVAACECACHSQKAQAPRRRDKGRSSGRTLRRAPIGRTRGAHGADSGGLT